VTRDEIEAFERCLAAGGVVLFPADTVYGLACDPEDEAAVRRLYELKRRPPDQPAAVMFFDSEQALRALPELRAYTLAAARRLLPGAVTVLLPNLARRFPLAGGGETLGLRVPALAGPGRPVLQSSANTSGEAEARRLADVPAQLRKGAALAIDGGELPGTPSTVVDLTAYEASGAWRIVRQGAVPPDAVGRALGTW
jgi:L-threonylcarbamoyladenylate synthase